MRFTTTILAAALALSVGTGPGSAADHTVKLLNKDGKGKFMLFEPDFLKVAPGDTVTFVPVDKGHNAEMIPEVWPEGAEKFKGNFNEEVELKIDKPGIYAIKCLPHFTMGMVALIVAGEPANLDKLKAFQAPGGAKKRLDALAAQVAP
jgi:pseudoazurin